ncbi:MAG: hypothetical protein JSR68_08265 [Proteobacteria bacterium]|nr:hypothetical protein [Pseudomonadota bacterium]
MAKADAPAATTPAPDAPKTDKALSAAQAAKRVGVRAELVLDFRDYGSHVVVVTRDGRKLSDMAADAGAGEE